MPRRVLITGITGFAGSHLAEHAVASGDEVHGLAFEEPPYPNLGAIAPDVRIHRGDLSDPASVRDAVSAARPDVIVHLAGQAVPSLAAQDPQAAIRVNVLGTSSVVEAARPEGVRVVFASTAEVYGVPDGPAREDAPLRPPNAYAATKVAAEALVRTLPEAVILRPVNQVGPRQHPALAASAFARQIALAEQGAAEPVIRHGRLDASRDIIDVRDMARAYRLAAELDGRQTLNVGSGNAVRMQELFDMLVAMSRVPLRTELDPERVRAGDPATVSVDSTAFRVRTGWKPEIELRRSLADLLEHWRARVRTGTALARA
ncbi:MAG TPA: GDP-mannose 4,6-dehydratase [Candidatus Limnocylindria bacterium]|nr:GDP-mannose 4,6-dehydratase [Candidatus Limnocylindria bacterium]